MVGGVGCVAGVSWEGFGVVVVGCGEVWLWRGVGCGVRDRGFWGVGGAWWGVCGAGGIPIRLGVCLAFLGVFYGFWV